MHQSQPPHYPPFGSSLPNRSWSDGNRGYRFGFNGKEKDSETASDNFDFGARIYDGRLGRWLSLDSYYKEYSSFSTYNFALNAPISYGDRQGFWVVGSDGNKVSYTKNQDGSITWSANATSDIVKIGNAMLNTPFGESSFNKWINANTIVHIRVDYENEPNDRYAETTPHGSTLNENGQYKEIDVVIFSKKIESIIKEGSGNRFEGATYDEALGAISTHEVYHNDPEQISLDLKIPERFQKTSKNKPINSEINFRREYRKKNGINGDDWENPYYKRGYKGLSVQENNATITKKTGGSGLGWMEVESKKSDSVFFISNLN